MKRILVVDDEPFMGELIKDMLEDDGFIVDFAQSCIDAKELIQQIEYDFIISDIKMPGMDGIEFYEWIRNEMNRIEDRIIFMSGDLTSRRTASFLQETSVSFLCKPFSESQLREMLVLRGKS